MLHPTRGKVKRQRDGERDERDERGRTEEGRHGGVEEERMREMEERVEVESLERNRAELLSDTVNLLKERKERYSGFLLIMFVEKQREKLHVVF